MNKNMLKDNRGLAPLIILAIIAVIAAVGGGAYFVVKKSPDQKKAQEVSKAENEIDQVGVSIPDLNFSQSPLPDLKVSALNISSPDLAAGGSIFTAPSVNTNFSYDVSSLTISTPSVSSYNIKMPEIPSVSTQSQPSTDQQAPEVPSSEQQGPSADCSQFSAVPSCSYVGAAGSPGYEMCKQCYPSK